MSDGIKKRLSTHLVCRQSKLNDIGISAGRLYDRIGKKAKAKVVMKFEGCAICKVSKDSLK